MEGSYGTNICNKAKRSSEVESRVNWVLLVPG
jgi:hypothetical protein